MKHFNSSPGKHARVVRRQGFGVASVALGSLLTAVTLVLALAGSAQAAATTVPLGTAGDFAVLAGSAVTNTGPSTINGSVGVSPGTSVSGFPPGVVVGGTIHAADAVALQAKSDLVVAYNVAAGEGPPSSVSAATLGGGQTLKAGVYRSGSTILLTGSLTLDAEGNPNSVFVFQAGSGLTTASGSTVNLINGAQACNVFWQIGSSATLGVGSTFRGTLLALTSISAKTAATIEGRLLARNGAVALDTNTILRPSCNLTPPTTSTPPSTTATSTPPTTPATTSTSTTATSTTPARTTTPPTTTTTSATPTQTNPGGNKPGGNHPGGNHPGGNHPGGNQPGNNQPGGNQPGGNQPGNNQPGGTHPGSTHPGSGPANGPNPSMSTTTRPSVTSPAANATTSVAAASTTAATTAAPAVPTAVEAGMSGTTVSSSQPVSGLSLVGFAGGLTLMGAGTVSLISRRPRHAR